MVGSPLPSSRWRWGPDDVILYHLGIGVGAERLTRLHERDLDVLPSFAATVAHATGASVDAVEGFPVDRSLALHGEQEVVVHRPIPMAADTETTGHVIEVCDAGTSTLLRVETQTHADGDRLFTTRFGIMVRDGGGTGRKRSGAALASAPSRAPDLVTRTRTSPRQAAIYRLLGDKNPLHIDPTIARARGFDRPILHGLSTYGAVLDAVVHRALDDEATRVGSYRARFRGHVFPGETLEVAVWHEAGAVAVQAKVLERGVLVLSHGWIELSLAED